MIISWHFFVYFVFMCSFNHFGFFWSSQSLLLIYVTINSKCCFFLLIQKVTIFFLFYFSSKFWSFYFIFFIIIIYFMSAKQNIELWFVVFINIDLAFMKTKWMSQKWNNKNKIIFFKKIMILKIYFLLIKAWNTIKYFKMVIEYGNNHACIMIWACSMYVFVYDDHFSRSLHRLFE